MSDIVSADVTTDVEFSGAGSFHATFVQVDRNTGTNSGRAKIKGVPESVDDIELNQRVSISINGTSVFEGQLGRAEQNEEGIIIVKAYDPMMDMHNQLVKLNTERPRFANEVARDLLDDAGYGVAPKTADPDSLEYGDAYVAPGREFPTEDTPGNREYGSANSGEKLSSVMEDLAMKLGGYFWVDRSGVIRLEPYPEHNAYELQNITKLGGGEQNDESTRVIVNGGSAASSLGPGASHVYDTVTTSSVADLPDPGEEREPTTKVISDDNIVTLDEAASTATKGAVDVQQKQSAGEVTVVGSVDISLLDTLIIPEIEHKVEGPRVGAPSWVNTLVSSSEYTASGVRHTINAQDGYTTRISLAVSTEDALRNVSGPASRIADQLLTYVRDQKSRSEILGITGTGP